MENSPKNPLRAGDNSPRPDRPLNDQVNRAVMSKAVSVGSVMPALTVAVSSDSSLAQNAPPGRSAWARFSGEMNTAPISGPRVSRGGSVGGSVVGLVVGSVV